MVFGCCLKWARGMKAFLADSFPSQRKPWRWGFCLVPSWQITVTTCLGLERPHPVLTRTRLQVYKATREAQPRAQSRWVQVINIQQLHSPPTSWCGSVDWAPACEPKVCWFNSHSGHMPGLQARSPSGSVLRGNRLMFLSLSFSLLSPPYKNK